MLCRVPVVHGVCKTESLCFHGNDLFPYVAMGINAVRKKNETGSHRPLMTSLRTWLISCIKYGFLTAAQNP